MKRNFILSGLFGLICSCDSLSLHNRISHEQTKSVDMAISSAEQQSDNRHKAWILKDLTLISHSNSKFKRLLERTKWIELNYPLRSNPQSSLVPKQNSNAQELKGYRISPPVAPIHSRGQKDLRLFVFVYSDSAGDSQKETLVQYEILTPTNSKIVEINRMMPGFQK